MREEQLYFVIFLITLFFMYFYPDYTNATSPKDPSHARHARKALQSSRRQSGRRKGKGTRRHHPQAHRPGKAPCYRVGENQIQQGVVERNRHGALQQACFVFYCP